MIAIANRPKIIDKRKAIYCTFRNKQLIIVYIIYYYIIYYILLYILYILYNKYIR